MRIHYHIPFVLHSGLLFRLLANQKCRPGQQYPEPGIRSPSGQMNRPKLSRLIPRLTEGTEFSKSNEATTLVVIRPVFSPQAVRAARTAKKAYKGVLPSRDLQELEKL